MKALIIFLLALTVSCFGQQDEKRDTIKIKKPPTVLAEDSVNKFIQPKFSNSNGVVVPAPFTIVEQMPQFPNGEKAMQTFIYSNLVYPSSAKGINGTCYITFIVNIDGSISNVMISRGVPNCPECDIEAKRVVSSMPSWKAGKQNGREVRVKYNVPIKFTLK